MTVKIAKIIILFFSIFFLNNCFSSEFLELKINSELIEPLREYLPCPALIYVFALEAHAFKANEKSIKLEKGCGLSAAGFLINEGVKEGQLIRYKIENKLLNLSYQSVINIKSYSIKISTKNRLIFNGYIENTIDNIEKKLNNKNAYYLTQIRKIQEIALTNKELTKSSNQRVLLEYGIKNIINTRGVVFDGSIHSKNFLFFYADEISHLNQYFEQNLVVLEYLSEFLKFSLFMFLLFLIYKK